MKTKAQTDAIRERLQELADRNGGRLTPDLVVTDAKRKDSPLHSEFQWDIKKAAAEYWIARAREIIASVTVVIRTTKVDIRSPVYIRDPNCAPREQGYVAVTQLRTDSDASRIALMTEFARVGDLLRRARLLAIVLEMDSEVDRLIGGVTELQERLQQPAPLGVM